MNYKSTVNTCTITCIHHFIHDEDNLICMHCGLEKEDVTSEIHGASRFSMRQQPISSGNYSVKIPTDDLNAYLEDITTDVKQNIIATFEMLLQKNNLRGSGKKALLAACYFYLASPMICRDVYIKFKINKKKFSEGKQIFLFHFPEYRAVERKISEFVECIFQKFSLPITEKQNISLLCKEIDNCTKFVNFNPYSVCACIIFRELSNTGLKKNIFLKQVGISDVTVQRISGCLKEFNDQNL